jgi:hypothetical protein
MCSTVNVRRSDAYGIQGAVVGTAIASAATIAPIAPVTPISGTAAIVTITPPAGSCTTSGFECELTFLPTGAFTWTTAGNIAASGTATVGVPVTARYAVTAAKWYLK